MTLRMTGLLTALAILAPPAQANGQDTKANTAAFSRFKIVVEGIRDGTLPFDVPIVIWGDIRRDGARAVSLRILRSRPGLDCRQVDIDPAFDIQEQALKRWTNAEYADRGIAPAPTDIDTDPRQQFEFLVGPFDYGKHYCFEFTLSPGEPLTEDQQNEALPHLIAAYQAFFDDRPALLSASENEAESLRQSVIERMLRVRVAGSTLSPEPGSVFDPATNSLLARNLFGTVFANIQEAQNNIETFFAQRAQSPVRSQQSDFLRAAATTVQMIDGFSAEELTPGARQARSILRRLDAAAVSDLFGYSRDGTDDLYVRLPLEPFTLDKDGSGCPSGGVLRPRCELLDQYERGMEAVTALQPTLPPEVVVFADALVQAKQELIALQNAVNERGDAIAEHVSAFKGRLLENVYAAVTTMGNLNTRRAWHTSATSGMAVAPSIGEVFPYVGAHFYFRPVNRDAPPRSWGTRTSFLLGFTWTSNLKRDGQRQALYGMDAMLLLGASVRLNDVLAVAGGSLLFKEANPNPLIQRTKLAMTPFFSLSLDLDLAGLVVGLFGSDAAAPRTIGGSTTER